MIYFVTGTDTDAGKTLVSSALLHLASKQTNADGQPWRTLGIKPVASGCQQSPQGLRNTDALALMAQSSVQLAYEKVNPFTFEPAIAPHIAAAQQNVDISPEAIAAALDMEQIADTDFSLIEGAGGWRLPLGNKRYLSQWGQSVKLPVIMVVGMKLGCLNHALLTQEAIAADGLTLAGWVANLVDPKMSFIQENLASLKDAINAPLLGEIPFLEEVSAENAARFLTLPTCVASNCC